MGKYFELNFALLLLNFYSFTYPTYRALLTYNLKLLLALHLGTIHKRRRQFFQIFDTPLPHVGSFLVLSVGIINILIENYSILRIGLVGVSEVFKNQSFKSQLFSSSISKKYHKLKSWLNFLAIIVFC